MTASSLPTPSSRLFRVPTWAWLVVILVAYAGFCAARFAPAISCADANGYWAQGTRLAREGHTWFEPESTVQYVGMHWLLGEDGRYYSRYPAGLPVAVAVMDSLFGYRASVLLNPLFAVLALGGIYLLARRFVDGRWALLAPLVLALNPAFSRHALQNDSHMAVLCLLAWGLALLVGWGETGSRWRLFVGAVFLGAIPAVRYPEALYGLAIATFLVWKSLGRKRPWLDWLVAAVGAALPLIPLMIHNQRAFGAFWNTAYSLTNEQTGFGWDYFADHAIPYLTALQGDGLGMFFALGLGATVAMCAVRRHRAEGAMFVLLIVPTTLLYMAYYWAPRMMTAGTMRFLLPTFVCYVVAAVWGLSELALRLPRRAWIGGVSVLLGLYAVWGGVRSVTETRAEVAGRRALARIAGVLENEIEDGAVVLAQSRVLQNLDFVGKWRLVDPRDLRGGGGLRRGMARDPDEPSPMQAEKAKLDEERYGGLPPRARMLATGRELRKWAGDTPIYMLGEKEELELFRTLWVGSCELVDVARIEFPESWREAARPEGRDLPGVGGPQGQGPGAAGPGGPMMRSGPFAGRQGQMLGQRGPLAGRQGQLADQRGPLAERRGALARRLAGGGLQQAGGRAGMRARRSYPLSCEELLLVRMIPGR